MKIVKAAVIGLVTAASLALATGCNNKSDTTAGGSPSPSPSPTKSATPTEAFTNAAALLRGTPYKFSLKGSDGTSYEGSADPLAGLVVAKLSVSYQGFKVPVDAQLSPNDYYLKVPAGLPIPGLDTSKWLHVDPTKVTSIEAVAFGGPTDPTGLKGLVAALGTAESTDGKLIKGTFDFTKGTWGPIANANVVKALGDKAKSVPFEATIGEKNRLATLKVTVPAAGSAKEQVVNITYSDFGTQVKFAAPKADETAEAPDLVYSLLNGA